MAGTVDDPAAQFAALSSALGKTSEFGIAADRVFGFEDWVGGRYSMWGPIGLSLMLAVGPENFRAFLRGAEAMDAHFRDTAPLDNMPVMLALTGVWHNQGCGYATRAVLPYEQRLSRLPAYLQQLEMESNGKRVSMDGADLAVESGPVVWGEPGTNGQHAFYQLIHQGTRVVPCEFMVGRRGHEPDLDHQHRLLIANCLAQSEALLRGRSLDEARATISSAFSGEELERQARHRVFPGNRPSTTLLYDRLDPETLGKIVALYEHRVFVEGVLLGINSFDQWGWNWARNWPRRWSRCWPARRAPMARTPRPRGWWIGCGTGSARGAGTGVQGSATGPCRLRSRSFRRCAARHGAEPSDGRRTALDPACQHRIAVSRANAAKSVARDRCARRWFPPTPNVTLPGRGRGTLPWPPS